MNTKERAQRIRQLILQTACFGGAGHIAPALSMADIIAELYFGGILKYDAQNPQWTGRDAFILSKGHACLALYAALAEAGFFQKEELRTFLHKGSRVGGHPNMHYVPGVEASTGALGHGLLFAVGIAIADKMEGKSNHTYVVIGDGECQEGSIWEGFMSAVYHKLDNLTVIIDHNKFQAMDRVETILGVHDFPSKLQAFGCAVREIDGHDHESIHKALLHRESGRPMVIVANTIKGKGISFMEEKPLWHCRMPNAEELDIALHDLNMKKEELEVL